MKILVAGDYCPHNRIATLIANKQYSSIYKEVIPYCKDSDLAIVNLEAPVTLNNYNPIKKCGPNLFVNKNAIEALSFMGFNLVTLANNHIMDYGEKGLLDTIKVCSDFGIETVGAGKNLEDASRIYYKRIKDKTLAIINCCEHEFSIASEHDSGANPLNPIQQYYTITEAKKNADYVLVIVHGGHEHFQLPSPRMINLYHYFIDLGVDTVINHHQHCYSGYELYKGKLIFYGLGNFSFDWENKYDSPWNKGYMICLDLKDKYPSFDIHPYIQGDLTNPGITFLRIDDKFNQEIRKINSIIQDPKVLDEYYKAYLKSNLKFCDFCFELYSGKIASKLFFKGILPSLYPKKKKVFLENMILCESHRDKILYYLKHKRHD